MSHLFHLSIGSAIIDSNLRKCSIFQKTSSVFFRKQAQFLQKTTGRKQAIKPM
uniref:Uncharacterized protein n=1 Tax=Arundo donax TaxID=35708 RepID=A0A0A9FCV8_ARUDO